jgi:cytochrome P450
VATHLTVRPDDCGVHNCDTKAASLAERPLHRSFDVRVMNTSTLVDRRRLWWRKAPSPPGHILWGHAPELSRDPLGALLRWQREHGDVVRIRLGTDVAHVVTHPHDVRRVLQENHTNYSKDTRGYAKLSLIMGRGLLTSDGDHWRKQRRLAQPAFHRRRIAALADIVVNAAEDALVSWRRYATRGEPFDVAQEMMRIALRVVGEALFGVDLSQEATRVQDAIRFIQQDAGRRIHSAFDVPLAVPTPNNVKLQRATAALDEILHRVIRRRRQQIEGGDAANDLLGMLLQACSGEVGMSDAELRDELMTMFLAGHESTANALTWCWCLLSEHGDVRDRMRDEARAVLGARRATYEDVAALRFTAAVFKETMRLYPPAWSMGRAPIEEALIGGYPVPAGSLVFLSPYVTHRHPAFWDEPEAFRPQRFVDDPSRDKLAAGYFPFGAGPRRCIGLHFAMMEGVLVLATIARELSLTLDRGQLLAVEPNITLRPRGSVWVKACAA